MGQCFSSNTPDESNRARTTKDVENDLKNYQKRDSNHAKLLLLGTGDSGKSTFVKQMKVLHKEGFSSKEVMKFQTVLRDNVINNMAMLLDYIEEHKEDEYYEHDVSEAKAQLIFDCSDGLKPDIAEAVMHLWNNEPLVKKVYREHGVRLQLGTSTDYFVENCERFAEDDFKPTDEDMLRARLRTTGIMETVFTLGNVRFTIVDVGGQRSERRKWLSCFEGVTAVIYLAALDEYDMRLKEDDSVNRLDESLRLFGEVSSSQWFSDSAFILFLNKIDLFEKKLTVSPLDQRFEGEISHEQATNLEEATNFIENKYQEAFAGKSNLYTYPTCAIDTENCNRVFQSVRDTIISATLELAGF